MTSSSSGPVSGDVQRVRVTYIATAPLPYDTPILNALAERVDLTVIYLRDSHALSSFSNNFGVEPEFQYRTFPSISVRSPGSDFWIQLTAGISLPLQRMNPDVVLVKSWNPFVLEALLWTRARGRRIVMWSESVTFSGLMRGRISERLRSSILARMDRVVTIGSQASAYVRHLGVQEYRIAESCLPSGLADRAISRSASIRDRPAAEEQVRFLFVGRLVPLKQVNQLIEAFRKVQEEHPFTSLTVVGDGPLSLQLQEVARSGGKGIDFRGWLEADELSSEMRDHDVLVLPSQREVWGLVVNEALAHGLYVVASDQVGSAYDLLTDDEIGLTVGVDDLGALASAMSSSIESRNHSLSARNKRVDRISACSVLAFAKVLAEAGEQAIKS